MKTKGYYTEWKSLEVQPFPGRERNGNRYAPRLHFLSNCLLLYEFVHPSVHLFAGLPITLSVHPSNLSSSVFYPFILRSARPSVSLSIHLSVRLSIHQFLHTFVSLSFPPQYLCCTNIVCLVTPGS
ncbi:hypothetical protein CHARACLAT_007313 [Characodon lateralis]|uniref:Uncharacterized protein n=1 Tax=Characodon lateralis TaxID=208331 RepID=A0ABU7E7T8_9TELE|nr:hypothetical protein [Characodon lateralis]